MQRHLFAGAGALALCAFGGVPAYAAEDAEPAQVVVTGQRLPANLDQIPVTVESVTADQIQATINASTVEDALKYLPDVFIRQRHIGDTQDPITTRTSGVGSSARSLIYADGVLLSALIGNNNTNASPRWGMVSPEEISRIDVLYGPFAAAFPGNSIGEVVEITTRMPDHFEATATAEGAWQDFHQYGTKNTYPTGRASGTVGDRFGKFSFWLSVDHTDTESQPLLYVTGTTPATTSTSGTPVTGSYTDANRNGAPIQVLGAGGLEHQTLDNAKLKLGYDLTPTLSAAYTLGFFQNNDSAGIQTYLQNAAGAPVYSGALNINGRAYSVAASAFSNDRYHLIEDHVMQSLSVGSHTDGLFDWSAIASLYDYAKDRQRTPALAFPAAAAGGAGTILSLNGTGWETLDLKGTWRPQGLDGINIVTAGLHEDGFKLDNPKYNTPDWIDGPATTTAAFSGGKTETEAAWLQDQIALTSQIKLTLGGRYEYWRAFDGVNYSLTPALNVRQPDLSASHFSPKGSSRLYADRRLALHRLHRHGVSVSDGGGAVPVRDGGRNAPGPQSEPEAGGRHLRRTRRRAPLDRRPCAPQPLRRAHHRCAHFTKRRRAGQQSHRPRQLHPERGPGAHSRRGAGRRPARRARQRPGAVRLDHLRAV